MLQLSTVPVILQKLELVQETELKPDVLEMDDPPGSMTGEEINAVPFHSAAYIWSISVPVPHADAQYQPVARQNVLLVQLTASRSFVVVVVASGELMMLHDVPFHVSASVWRYPEELV